MVPKHKTINGIIQQMQGTHYLEIGVGDGYNINAIRCQHKTGVDPGIIRPGLISKGVKIHQTDSDTFFRNKPKNERFDVIFIDGLHHADQVEKDIINSWYSLKAEGVILIHDVNPPTKAHQVVPRSQLSWTGDVWKAFVGFRQKYENIPTGYIPERYGLGWIKKAPMTKVEAGFVLEARYKDLQANLEDWLGFDKIYGI